MIPAIVEEPSDRPLLSDAGSNTGIAAAAERLIPYVRILAALAVVAALWWGQAVWIPLVLSVLISYALEPVVAFLASHRLPRAIAVPLLLTSLLAVGGAGAYQLRGEAGAFIDRLPVAAHTVAQAIQKVGLRGPGNGCQGAGCGAGA